MVLRIWRGHIPERSIRVFAQLDNLAHWPMRALYVRNVSNNPAGHLHRDEWVTVDVRILSQREVFNAFANVKETFTEFSVGHCAH